MKNPTITFDEYAARYDLDFADMLDFTLLDAVTLHETIARENALNHAGATLAEIYAIETMPK